MEACTSAAGFLLLTCLHHLYPPPQYYNMPQWGLCSCLPCFLYHGDTPSSQPRACSITPLLPLLASCSSDPSPASCDPAPPPPPVTSPQASQVSYIWTIRCTPIFLPNFGGKVCLTVQKIWYMREKKHRSVASHIPGPQPRHVP